MNRLRNSLVTGLALLIFLFLAAPSARQNLLLGLTIGGVSFVVAFLGFRHFVPYEKV